MLSNEIIPFLTSNVYINFANAPKTIQKANELTRYALNDVEKYRKYITMLLIT